jgi:hypothetical protein
VSVDPVLYEMRSYRVADGRMADELERGLACILSPAEGGRGLFNRYRIPRPVGLWRVLSGAKLPAVIFLYRWNSVAERAHAFETFYDDPEWSALRAGSNEGSEIVGNMDDVLLRGPPPQDLPPEGLYEFVRGAAPSGARVVIGPLAPLCGDDASDLHVILHDGAIDGAISESRILCRHVALSMRS